jgi:hypothetical protein
MVVSQECSVTAGAVELNVEGRQQLRHTIRCDDEVEFTLKDHSGNVLLPLPSGPLHVRVWPIYPAEVPALSSVTNPLGMVFGTTAKLEWLIELLDANGTTLRTVKSCVYKNDAGPAEFFDAIRIFIVRGT